MSALEKCTPLTAKIGPIIRYISEMVQDRRLATVNHTQEVTFHFALVPKLVMLNAVTRHYFTKFRSFRGHLGHCG